MTELETTYRAPLVDPVAILKLVQARCADRPEIYPSFIDLISQSRDKKIQLGQFLQKCIDIMHTYPDLVLQLNSFLPQGFGVVYDHDTTRLSIVQPDNDDNVESDILATLYEAVNQPEVQTPLGTPFTPTLNDARAFLQLIKARIEPLHATMYEEFLDVVEEHRKSKSKKKTRKLKLRLVQMLSIEFPDLLFVLRLFLPDSEQIQVEASSLSMVQYSPLLPLYARFVQDVFVPLPQQQQAEQEAQ